MENQNIKKILICDDHPICQVGLEYYLRQLLPTPIVYKADFGQQMLDLCTQHTPDFLFLDLNLPDYPGYQLISEVRKISSETRIFVVTSCDDATLLRQIRDSKVDALLWKSHSQETLGAALKNASITPFSIYIDDGILKLLETRRSESLTKREWQVLELIAQGCTNDAISKALGCTLETVKSHRANLGQKTQSRNRAELTAWFLQRNGKTHAGNLIRD